LTQDKFYFIIISMKDFLIADFAPPTSRDAISLAFTHDQGWHEMLNTLPKNATIADIGAGASPFGAVIAARRPDITWYNVDPRYGNAGRLAITPPEAPPNVHYVTGDIVRDGDSFPLAPGSIDRVYSSAVLPHLIMSSRQIGHAAVHAMARLAKPDGTVSISGFDARSKAIQFDAATYKANPEDVAVDVVDKLALSPGRAFVQRFDNLASWILRRPFALVEYIPRPSSPY
jgi:hypothetical protein